MKGSFILVSWCIAGTIAYLGADLTTDLGVILQARHLDHQLKLFSRSATKRRHQKRGGARESPYDPQHLAKESGKTKKAVTQQSNPQPGKATDQQPGQQRGNTDNQQRDQGDGKASSPRPAPRPPPPIPPPAQRIRADVNLRGPGYVHTIRGQDMHGEEVSASTRRRRVAVHPVFAAAGGMSTVNPPTNAVSQPISEHPVKTYAKGPIAGASFNVPRGGRAYATADVPGQQRRTWDIRGPDERVVNVHPHSPVPVTLRASVTEGGLVQSSGSDGTGRGPRLPPR